MKRNRYHTPMSHPRVQIYVLIETIGGQEKVTAEFPARDLIEAANIGFGMWPRNLPATIRSKKDQ
jgi:hypothetical protein